MLFLEVFLIRHRAEVQVVQRETNAHLDGFFVELDVQGLETTSNFNTVVPFERELSFECFTFLLLQALDVLFFGQPVLHRLHTVGACPDQITVTIGVVGQLGLAKAIPSCGLLALHVPQPHIP